VLADEFTATRSQRRVLNRWEGLYHVEYGPASWSEEKLALFNKHKDRRNLREQDCKEMTADGYVGWLVNSCFHTVEMRYYIDGALVGVGILDLGEVSASSVYYFFDPDPEISKLSPGVFSVMQELEFCRATGRKYLYLGLYVRGCPELSYKRNYYPHERVEQGTWQLYPDAKSDPHNAKS
jgi:arginine-tRNA-protein transferase